MGSKKRERERVVLAPLLSFILLAEYNRKKAFQSIIWTDISLKTFYFERIKIYLVGIANCPLFSKLGFHPSPVSVVLFYIKLFSATASTSTAVGVGIGSIAPEMVKDKGTQTAFSCHIPTGSPRARSPVGGKFLPAFILENLDQTSHFFCSSHSFLAHEDTYFFFFFSFLIFGCVGSSLLHVGFLWLWQAGAALCCSQRASHWGGFSCCGARALGAWASVVAARRLSTCGTQAQ